jgi:RimJ/RimL family protein N-acetyltransferase
MTDELRTDRLLLRQWRDADLDPWAAMNADPQVREFLGEVLTREQSRQSMDRFRADLDERGWGWWAVEVVATGEFVGFTGLVVYRLRRPAV